jgi:hypothetical protein
MRQKKGTLHLIHGYIGAGKTTFARKLEKDLPAMRLSVDEWMHQLYGNNPPADKYADYHERLLSVLWQIASATVTLGVDVVFDEGFWRRVQWDDARKRAEAIGAKCVLYRVSCSDELALARTLQRNKEMPKDSVYIYEDCYRQLKSRFEPLGEDEEHVDV